MIKNPKPHKMLTIVQAPKTPKVIHKNASFGLILNKTLTTAPVQAPVIGEGIATNIAKANLPQAAYFPSKAILARLNHQSKNFLKKVDFCDK